MLTAAFTIVQNDMTILNLWLSYYHKYFDDLLVICDLTKKKYLPQLKEMKAKYGMNYEFSEDILRGTILESLADPTQAIQILKDKQQELLKDHDWVLYSNCDEYVVANPKRFKDLKDFMEKCQEEKVACVGYEVFQAPREHPINYSYPYLSQRKYWFKNPNMNKIILSKVRLNWVPGCHKEGDTLDEESKIIKNNGLYLIHLKYSDLEAKRDFGPTIFGLEWGLLEIGKNRKWAIPKEIRRLF